MTLKFLHLLSFAAIAFAPAVSFGQTATAPNLGVAAGFALFTHAGAISNTGPTVITGDVGTVSGAVNGFAPTGSGVIIGTLHTGDALSIQAQTDVQSAYQQLAANSIDSTLNSTTGLGNKQVLKPYVYFVGGATVLSDTLFLDAAGNPAALFFFQINGVLSTAATSRIVLLNGASLSNVYFRVNGATNFGAQSIFQGTVIANGALNLGNGAAVRGRALSTFDAINLDSNTVSLPTVSVPTGIGTRSATAPVAYPNPVLNSVQVEGALPGSSIVLMDMTGKTLQRQIAGSGVRETVTTSGLSTGIYLLKVVTADGQASTIRLAKQ